MSKITYITLLTAYLADWQVRLKQIEAIPLQADKTVLLGRRASMAAGLVQVVDHQEAAKLLISLTECMQGVLTI